MNFSSQIIDWYKQHKRELPWRRTSDPYKIWLSEIILQQTQVVQGLPYYERFISTFPDVHSLANSNEEEVMKLWQGLGYYSRARNLHFAANQIISMGTFPNTYESILSLKGVGEYTAAAIASFAFKLPHAVVDGNVYRLLARFFGIKTNIDSSSGKTYFNELANSLLDNNLPDLHNQAIMEFGSQMCKPAQPNCISCPLNEKCYAFNTNKVQLFPVKIRKKKVKNLYFEYFFFEFDKHTYIQKRKNNGIWKNLYEFPLIESNKQLSKKAILSHRPFQSWLREESVNLKIVKSYKHILSHRIIFARFWQIECKNKIVNHSFIRIKKGDLEKYPISRLTEKFLKEIIF